MTVSRARPGAKRLDGSTRLAGLGVAAALALAGCTDTPGPVDVAVPQRAAPTPTPQRVEPDLDSALSTPVEDSVYPQVGDPGVDALHYGLDLAWDPGQRRLDGTATITFRATADADRFQLDFAHPLRASAVTLDGEPVTTRHPGKDLVVAAPVAKDRRYELVVTYAGHPHPVPAPTTRRDFSTTGFTVTGTGEVWTMQEPFGAYSWYPVNDQPADKALYDFTVAAPSPWTGLANGRLLSLDTADGTTTTQFQLDDPASSYLVTLAIGDYTHASNRTRSGLTLDYWYPRGLPTARGDLRVAARSVDWIEERLGPYPFSSLGVVLTDSMSAMETQTLVTLGNNEYVRSPDVVTHELIHQWYGDKVTPSDWRDVWLNEGMTMLMQGLYQSDRTRVPFERIADDWASRDEELRAEFGPPGAYDPAQFGGSNIYYCPALMWNELRVELGDERFFAISRAWLEANDNGSVSREEIFAFWEQRTGKELSAFFDAWILGDTTPPRKG